MAGKPTRKQPPTGKRIDLRPTRKTILKPPEGVTEIVITPQRQGGKLHIRVEGWLKSTTFALTTRPISRPKKS